MSDPVHATNKWSNPSKCLPSHSNSRLDCQPSCGRSILPEILREDSLPNIEPLLLLGSGQLARLLERPSQNLAQASSENFDNEHRLPVWDDKATSVSVQDNYSRIHLVEALVLDQGHQLKEGVFTSHRTSPHKRAIAKGSTAVASWA